MPRYIDWQREIETEKHARRERYIFNYIHTYIDTERHTQGHTAERNRQKRGRDAEIKKETEVERRRQSER